MESGKPNSSVHSSPSGYVIDWGRFKSLPTQVDTGLDVAALQSRLLAVRFDPCRWRVGVFRTPIDANPEQYLKLRNKAVGEFVRAIQAQGWEIQGRITVTNSKYIPADPDNNILEGYREYKVKALFKKLDLRPVKWDVSHLVGEQSHRPQL